MTKPTKENGLFLTITRETFLYLGKDSQHAVPFRTDVRMVLTYAASWLYAYSHVYASLIPHLDARNILRPETVESLFLAWRATIDPIYR